MRAQFQERLQVRSGLPRPTRTGIPAPSAVKPATIKQATSPVQPLSSVLNTTFSKPDTNLQRATPRRTVHNGNGLKTDPSPCQGRSSTPSANGPIPHNGSTGNGTVRQQHVKPLCRQPALVNKGGALTTMTTAQLKALSNGQSRCANAAVPPARTTAGAPGRMVAPLNRKPPTVMTKCNSNSLPKSMPVEPVKVAMSARQSSLAARNSHVASRKALPLQIPQSSFKAPPPELRPLGPNQERCDVCSRGFDKERIEKHRVICQKAAAKKVKVFDVTKMRTKGTEAEAFVKRGLHKKEVPVKKSNWRAKHEEFLSAVRQARLVQEHLAAGGKLSDLPPPPPSVNPDYVQCPKCNRRFNEAAAERHIPRCKESSAVPRNKPNNGLAVRK